LDDANGTGIANLANVDSVEVLKGPAAILYGRVEPGGVVNLVTKQPQVTPGYSLEQSIGSYNHYVTDFDATGPVNEDKTLLYRLIATYDKSGSWRSGPTLQDDLFTRKFFVAPTLQWKLGPQTQVTLEAEYNHNNVPYDVGQMNPFDSGTSQYVMTPRKLALITGETKLDTTFIGLNWSHQFSSDWSIRQQFVHDKGKFDMPDFITFDFSGANLFTQSGSTWTVDRGLYPLSGYQTSDAVITDVTGHLDTAGLKHTVLVGADYYRLKNLFLTGGSSTFVTTDIFNPVPVTGLTLDPALSNAYAGDVRSYGAYLQDQVKLPHDVQVLGGLRYQKVTRSGSATYGAGTSPIPDDAQDDHAVTPRLGVLWQARQNLSLYADYAENFGANNGRDVNGSPLKPQSAQQYEIGAKTATKDNKLTSSLALFNLTKQNVATADPLNSGYNIAIGEVRSRGIEFDVQGELAPGWEAIATYTYTDIVITKSNNGDQGLRMANVPRNMASFSNTYKLPQESLRGWKIGGGVFWRDSAPDASNTLTTPGRAIFNAMTAYESKAGSHKTTFQLNIENLFNKRYAIDRQEFGNGEIYTPGTPRTVTASFKLEL
jgi:iron complex outermembrane receptor protein